MQYENRKNWGGNGGELMDVKQIMTMAYEQIESLTREKVRASIPDTWRPGRLDSDV